MSYPMNAVRGDIFGGLTAGIIALPLALAFGVASGAGAAAGLYGAIALGLFASIFGGTRTQVSGPTGPMTVVMGTAVAAFSGQPEAVCLVVLLCGLFQMLFGVFRLGGVVKFIPYPVISGFMNGIGVIIVLLQIQPLMGCQSLKSPLLALMGLPDAVAAMNLYAVGLAAATMAIVFLTPVRISRVVPSPLIALISMSVLAYALKMPVPTIGAIPSGLPELHIPGLPLADWGRIATLGFALALLGTIDTLLTSIVADSMSKDQHNSNRELIGQGLGNMVAGFVGGLPGAGATMRTVVNIKAGGTTRLSGVIHALFLVAVLLGLGPLTASIPLAVLAGILVKVGVDILDYKLLRLVRKAPKQDLVVMLAVFGITVFVDLIVAVGVGVALACLMLAYRVARQTRIQVTSMEDDADRDKYMDAITASDKQVRVITINGAFFFGTSSLMQDKVDRLYGTRCVVVNCTGAPFMDISAVFALSEMLEKLVGAGVRVMLVVNADQRTTLAECGAGDILPAQDVFSTLDTALDAALDAVAIDHKDKAARIAALRYASASA